MMNLKPFEPGDIFVTANDLDESARFPTGQSKVRHYDRNWTLKAEVATGHRGLVSALSLDATGTLHILDPQARRVDHVGPVTMRALAERAYGSMIPLSDGSYLIGEHMVGQIPGFSGDGKAYQVDADGTELCRFDTETNGGMGGFLGVTHMALSNDGKTLYHVSETGTHIYAHDLDADKRLGPIYTRADPPPLVFGIAALADGTLLAACGNEVRRIDASGQLVRTYAMPEGRGWAVVVLRGGGETFWALDFFGGTVACVETESGLVLQTKDLSLTKCLAGIAEVPE
jgi:hypothetical protein